MEQNNAAFPPPPFWYQRGLQTPPKPPLEGEFSMFGRVYTTKEMPLKIEGQNFELIPEANLQDPSTFNKDMIFRLVEMLNQAALDLIKTLAESPLEAIAKFEKYEQLMLNIYQLVYWMRPMQTIVEIKNKLRVQISEKDKERQELKEELENLKEITHNIVRTQLE